MIIPARHRIPAAALMMLPGVAYAAPNAPAPPYLWPITIGVLAALHLVCLVVPLGISWLVFRGEGARWKRAAATLIGGGGLIALGWLTSLFPAVLVILVIILSGRTM